MAPRGRVLVVSNETVQADILRDTIVSPERATEIFVVAPALNTRLRHWTSDDDEARRAAGARLIGCLDALDGAGAQVHGWVGDADPLQAIEDALAVFPADELLIATHAEERSNWLAHDVVARVRARFDLPVVQLVAGAAFSAAA